MVIYAIKGLSTSIPTLNLNFNPPQFYPNFSQLSPISPYHLSYCVSNEPLIYLYFPHSQYPQITLYPSPNRPQSLAAYTFTRYHTNINLFPIHSDTPQSLILSTFIPLLPSISRYTHHRHILIFDNLGANFKFT
jgi:hypothetical protein